MPDIRIRPTLLNSCAKAATAAEARFRIDRPIAELRATRVVALDEGAAAVVRGVADQPWRGARFFGYEPRTGAIESNGHLADIVLRSADGSTARLSVELEGADVVVMIATADDGAEGAAVIGDACTLRGIMTAGLIIGEGRDAGLAVSALRPHARVLMRSRDGRDVSDVLKALRA
jgi:hypothetical protein